MNRVHLIETTVHNLKSAGNSAIKRRLRNKGFHWGPALYEMSHELYEIYENREYLVELDHGWSKEYTRLNRRYRQCCRKILKHMRKMDRWHKKFDRKERNNEAVDQ